MNEDLNPIERGYRQLLAEGRQIRRMFSGNPNEQGLFFPSTILEACYREYFERQEYQPDPKGLRMARDSIRGYYLKQGVDLDPEAILLTSGTSESFLHLFSTLARSGENILVPRPGYPLFDPIARMLGVQLRHYSLKEEAGWTLSVEEIEKRADAKTRALVLVSPSNPTGAVHPPEEIERAVHWCNQAQIPLICDEVFSEFFFGNGAFPRVVQVAKPFLAFTLNGISKMFALPALKCSWIAVSGESSRVVSAVDHLEMLTDTFLSCHTPIQKALPRLFEKGGDFLTAYRREVSERRTLALDLLGKIPGISWTEPQGGFYGMFKVERSLGLSEEDWILHAMKEKGLFFHPGYFYDWEEGVHAVLSFLTRREELQAALSDLKTLMESDEG